MYKLDLSCAFCKEKKDKIIKEVRESENPVTCTSCKEKHVEGLKDFTDEKIISSVHNAAHPKIASELYKIIVGATMKESQGQGGFKFYGSIEEMISGNKIREALETAIDEKKEEMELSDEKHALLKRAVEEYKEWSTYGAVIIERVRGAVHVE